MDSIYRDLKFIIEILDWIKENDPHMFEEYEPGPYANRSLSFLEGVPQDAFSHFLDPCTKLDTFKYIISKYECTYKDVWGDCKNVEMLTHLVSNKYCDVNYMLIHAATKRHNFERNENENEYTIDMFDYLVSQGADAFDEAIKECKDPEIIEYLIKHGADINVKYNHEKQLELERAAQLQFYEDKKVKADEKLEADFQAHMKNVFQIS
jgi:hypothetical protein